jgi:hypothetical protein
MASPHKTENEEKKKMATNNKKLKELKNAMISGEATAEHFESAIAEQNLHNELIHLIMMYYADEMNTKEYQVLRNDFKSAEKLHFLKAELELLKEDKNNFLGDEQ